MMMHFFKQLPIPVIIIFILMSSHLSAQNPQSDLQHIPQSIHLETETALTSPVKELRIGIWDATYQISSRFNLKMWTAPSLLKIFNFGFRFNLFQTNVFKTGRFFSNLDFHYASINLNAYGNQKNVDKRINIVPIFFNLGWFFERIYLGLSLRFYTVEGDLSSSADADLPFGTVLASSNQQLKLQLGYAMSERWSIWAFYHQVLHQSYQGSAYLNAEISPGINIEAYGQGKIQAQKNGKALGFRLVRKGDWFDFQIGFDRGQPPIYVTGLFLSNQTYTLPYLDFSFKF